MRIETIAELDDVIPDIIEYFADCLRPIFVSGQYSTMNKFGSIYCLNRGGPLEDLYHLRIAEMNEAEYSMARCRIRTALLEAGNVVIYPIPIDGATHKLIVRFDYLSQHQMVEDDCYLMADDTDAFMVALRLGARLEKLK